MAKLKIGKCIYCQDGIDKQMSREHHLLEGFGKFRNYELLDDRICIKHNNDLGNLDEQLLRCGPEAFFRESLGIVGKRNRKKINPFIRGSSGGAALKLEGKYPNKDYPVLYEPNRGMDSMDLMTQIVFKVGDDYIKIPIPEDLEKPEEFKKLLNHRNISEWQEAYVTHVTQRKNRLLP
ncbi:MAG TPA: hypothetical protein VFZ34_29290 [Blastocatellia bacterium]|nr:hypothetical protein [Blastocatellia bacterium]